MGNSMQILETRVMKTCHCNVILNTLSNAIVCLHLAFHTIFQQNEGILSWISAMSWSDFYLSNFTEMWKEL